MDRKENVILTNMCMIYDSQGRVLVQNRTDQNWPGVTFPGGHIEKQESLVQSVIREVKEETGLTISNPILCGVKQFPINEGRYIVFLFKTNQFTGNLENSSEGEVFWIKREEIANYPLSKDFDKMLAVFENYELSEFYYTQSEGEWEVKLL